jgi:glycosyltransferase involved in cell wall biosynthesis
MRFIYLSSSTLPSKDANSIHVMKMADAFAILGCNTILIGKEAMRTEDLGVNDIEKIFRYYGTRSIFEIRLFRPVFRFVKYLQFLIWISYLISRTKGDIYYTRDFYISIILILHGKKTILESHRPLPNVFFLKIIYNRIIRNSKFIRHILISEGLKKRVIHNSFSTEKLMVLHDGADIPKKTENFKNFIQLGTFNVGYCGHMYEGRGIDILIDVARSMPSISFHLVGGRDEDIKYWKNKAKGVNNIFLYGHISPNLVPSVLQLFDILVAPYQKVVRVAGGVGNTSDWMSPLKIFEYMAASRPMIVSDLPALREIICENVTGLFASPDSTSDWVKNINLLKNNKELRVKLGNLAKKDFIQKYTWDKRAQSILNVLK